MWAGIWVVSGVFVLSGRVGGYVLRDVSESARE